MDEQLPEPVELHCLGGFLVAICYGRFRHLRLRALDPYDLALSKLSRNSPVDREDAAHLAT